MSQKGKLTEKQYIFCKEYLVSRNCTDAALKAGYSKKTAYSQGHRLLKNVEVKAFIDKETEKRVEKLDITADKVLQEMAKIAFHDIRKLYNDNGSLKQVQDLDDEAAAVISSFKSRREYQGEDEDGNAEYVTIDEYKRFDKIKSLEMLGKHLGIFDKDSDKPNEDKVKKIEVVYGKPD